MKASAIIAIFVGFLFFKTASCQVCLKKDPAVELIANITGNATFYVQLNDTDEYTTFFLFRMYEEKRTWIVNMYFMRDGTHEMYADSAYKGRFSSVVTTKNIKTKDIFVTLSAVEVVDAGIYGASSPHPKHIKKCFTLYVLGNPTSTLRQIPAVVEEGNAGHLQCLTRSTTVPATHNLTIDISWFIGGQRIETDDRFRVAYNELSIYFMSRADKNLTVLCEAHEYFGLTSWANITMEINWGPSPGPDLWPATTFYYQDFGDRMPTINCTADCHPDCEITWRKMGRLSAIDSWNGLLSLGSVSENTTGEYVCTASRNGTFERNSKSVTLMMSENKVSAKAFQERATATTTAVGGVLGAALLLSLLFIAVMIRKHKFHCVRFSEIVSKYSASSGDNVTIETAPSNRMYEDLYSNRGAQESYDSVNIGPTEDDSAAGSWTVHTSGSIYENNSP